MIKKVPQQFRIPISIASLLLGAYLLVISYTPGGNRPVGLRTLDGGTFRNYGAEISPFFVILGVCCFIVAFYFYKNRNVTY